MASVPACVQHPPNPKGFHTVRDVRSRTDFACRSSVMPRRVIRHRPGLGAFGWGLFGQSLSSAKNFTLTLVAARLLGPSGLGVVAIGFSVYLITFVLNRALVLDPLVVSSARLARPERRRWSRNAVTIVLSMSCGVAVLLMVAGMLVPGHAGRSLFLFAPWIVPALLQDSWRVILFRDKRGGRAAANDGVWLAVMLLALPLAWDIATDWALVGCWGLGATAGALLGFVQTGAVPAPLPRAFTLWRAESWQLARWLTVEQMVYVLDSQGAVFLIGGLLGASAVGGMASILSVFSPLSLLGPAIALPGLPAMTRALARDARWARTIAARISVAMAVMVGTYVLVLSAAASFVVPRLFGSSFVKYEYLVPPLGIQQVITAGGAGLVLFMKASRRGRGLFRVRVIGTTLNLTLVALAAVFSGLAGVAWAMVAAIAVWVALLLRETWWPRGENNERETTAEAVRRA